MTCWPAADLVYFIAPQLEVAERKEDEVDGAYAYESGADDADALINIANMAESDERKLIKTRMRTSARGKRASCYIVYLVSHFQQLGRSHDMDPRLATDFVKARTAVVRARVRAPLTLRARAWRR